MFRLVFKHMFNAVKRKDILIITSNGKLSNKLINRLQSSYSGIQILQDRTMTFKKMVFIFKNNQKLNLKFYLNLFFNELIRKQFKYKKIKSFSNKDELLNHLNDIKPKLILVFRGSYIFPLSILTDYKIFNIHCADIGKEEYKGLGGVYLSYINKEKKTFVSFHHMDVELDSGEIILKKEYNFDFKKSYFYNENLAYDTGIDLLISQIEEAE